VRKMRKNEEIAAKLNEKYDVQRKTIGIDIGLPEIVKAILEVEKEYEDER